MIHADFLQLLQIFNQVMGPYSETQLYRLRFEIIILLQNHVQRLHERFIEIAVIHYQSAPLRNGSAMLDIPRAMLSV